MGISCLAQILLIIVDLTVWWTKCYILWFHCHLTKVTFSSSLFYDWIIWLKSLLLKVKKMKTFYTVIYSDEMGLVHATFHVKAIPICGESWSVYIQMYHLSIICILIFLIGFFWENVYLCYRKEVYFLQVLRLLPTF